MFIPAWSKRIAVAFEPQGLGFESRQDLDFLCLIFYPCDKQEYCIWVLDFFAVKNFVHRIFIFRGSCFPEEFSSDMLNLLKVQIKVLSLS